MLLTYPHFSLHSSFSLDSPWHGDPDYICLDIHIYICLDMDLYNCLHFSFHWCLHSPLARYGITIVSTCFHIFLCIYLYIHLKLNMDLYNRLQIFLCIIFNFTSTWIFTIVSTFFFALSLTSPRHGFLQLSPHFSLHLSLHSPQARHGYLQSLRQNTTFLELIFQENEFNK